MLGGGGGDGGEDGRRRRPNVLSTGAGTSKRLKKGAPLELEVYRNPDLLAYNGWEEILEP